MKIDLSTLSAEELDELIAKAVEKRAEMQPGIPATPPQNVNALVNPIWRVFSIKNGTVLQIKHPGFGWFSFFIPHAERVRLMTFLLQHSLIADPDKTDLSAPVVPVITPDDGGGKVH